MRLSLSDIERLVGFLRSVLKWLDVKGDKVDVLLSRLLEFFKENERTLSGRLKLRLAEMIDEIESKRKMKREDKIKLKTLKEVMKIIEEEEKKIL